MLNICRFDVEPGDHLLTLCISSAQATEKYHLRLTVQKDDLCIVNIFNIHPGVTSIQIPKHFGEAL